MDSLDQATQMEVQLPQQKKQRREEIMDALAECTIPQDPTIMWYESLFASIGEALRKEKQDLLKRKRETQLPLANDDGERVSDSNKPRIIIKLKHNGQSIPQVPNTPTPSPTPSPSPAPALAEEFKRKICELGGTEETFLYQKRFYRTDLTQRQNRFSMPLKQIKTTSFLREYEKTLVNGDGLEVSLLQPNLEQWKRKIVLKKWDMRKKKNDRFTSMYVLRGSWHRMTEANNFKLGDLVQMWSFRVQEKLWMALIKV